MNKNMITLIVLLFALLYQSSCQKQLTEIQRNLKQIEQFKTVITRKTLLYCNSTDQNQRKKLFSSIFYLTAGVEGRFIEIQRIPKRQAFKGRQRLIKKQNHKYINVTIRALSGMSTQYQVDQAMTFLELRSKISPQFGYQPQEIDTFIVHAKIVALQQRLRQVNVQDGDFIHSYKKSTFVMPQIVCQNLQIQKP